MIIQGLMDFLRDTIVNWLVGVASLWSASDVTGFLAGLSLPTAQVGHLLAVIVTPGGWAANIALMLAVGVFWLATQVFAFIITRLRA